ncbi:MAG: cytochrome d ubiquinol oxidase subunit II [Chlamydiales bacterium]
MIEAWEYGLMIFWYIVFVVSVACYGMLDGFDLGVGSLHLFVKKDEERRIFLNAIGPVWDGNEVWLVIVVGGMFAGFPSAYATFFSAFYIPIYFLIFALIFRAVAIEFRSKLPTRWWRSSWDVLFFLASVVIAFGLGVALGNLIQGIPLNEDHEYIGEMILTFLRPYPILVGILTLSLFTLHGTIYLVMKTEKSLQSQLIRWLRPTLIFFIISYAITTVVTLIYQEHMVETIRERSYLFFIALANIFVVANIPREFDKHRYGWAFICSCINIALLLILYALGSFPNLIRSSINPELNSITLINAASSTKTLSILSLIVFIGLPLVFGYGFFIYRLFRGKVKLDHMSY